MTCNQKKIISSIEIKDIVYGPDADNSTFKQGVSSNKKRLSIKIDSDSSFRKGSQLRLKLIWTRDSKDVLTKIEMKSYRALHSDSKSLTFEFVGEDVPIPFGLFYLQTIVQDKDEFHLQLGEAIEYRFVLRVRHESSCFRIPLKARYTSSDEIIDFKCEQPELVDTLDDNHPIRVLCGSTVFYSSLPHCVSHGQAPKPVVFYYEI